jgi:hypothetical protein
MKNPEVKEKIELVDSELGEARDALDALLRTMKVASRSEKTVVTKVVEQAFARIRAAEEQLLELRDLLEHNQK